MKIDCNILDKFGRKLDVLDSFCESDDSGQRFDARIYTFDGWSVLDTRVFNKKGYNSFYNLADKLFLETDKFEAHLIWDVSGYNYWTLDMNESNYLFLAIEFKGEIESESELESIMEEIQEKILWKIQTKWEYLIDNNYYTRKKVQNDICN